MGCVWRSRCRLLAMGLAAATIGTGCGTTSHQRTSPGEPESDAEVARELRHMFEGKRVSAVACHQTSDGHWTCVVRVANGARLTVLAVWYGRERTLGLSLGSAVGAPR